MTPPTPDRCHPLRRRRGTVLLLEHCARLERLMAAAPATPYERLERRLGGELARCLRLALCGDHALRAGFFAGG